MPFMRAPNCATGPRQVRRTLILLLRQRDCKRLDGRGIPGLGLNERQAFSPTSTQSGDSVASLSIVKFYCMSSFKRAFDVAGACAGLLVFAPVMAIAIVAVVIDDGLPAFFRQQRLGYRRRPFSILKIRTMRDGRTTRVGRALRATGLDEIPQFI